MCLFHTSCTQPEKTPNEYKIFNVMISLSLPLFSLLSLSLMIEIRFNGVEKNCDDKQETKTKCKKTSHFAFLDFRAVLTFLQSSQWVGLAPRSPNSSPHRIHWVEPFPIAFFFMLSSFSTRRLSKWNYLVNINRSITIICLNVQGTVNC